MTDLSTVTTAEILTELRRRRDESAAALDEFGTVTDIVEQAVMRAFDMSRELLHSRCQYAHVTLPRQIVMALMHENGVIRTDVDNHFNKTHGTANYAIKAIGQREDADSDFEATMRDLRASIAEALQPARA